MKKLFILLSFLMSAICSFAQYPNGEQTNGVDSNVVRTRGGLKARIIPYVYFDTAAANLERIRQYPGAEIYTSSDNKKWFRSATVDYWIQYATTTGYLWNNIANPTGTQSLTFDDGELNAWTVSSNTETFHTVTANSLTTGIGKLMTLNGLTTGKGISVTSSSTAKSAGNALFNANSSGANGSSSITNVGYLATVANTGTSSVNMGYRSNVSGASTNWAYYADAGNMRTTGASGFYSQNTAATAGISIAYDNSSIGTLSTTGGVRLDLDAASSTILMRRQTNIGLGIDFGNVPSFQVYKSASGTSNIQNWLSSGGAVLASFNQSGRLFIGSSTSAAALLHLAAGTATASTAPQKYTAGTLLSTIEALTTEVDASGKYQTNVALNRYAEGGYVKDFIATVDNSGTSETDLFTYTTKANTLVADGEKLIFEISGTLNDLTSTAQLQFYFGGTNIGNTGALTVSATGGWYGRILIIRTGSTTARSVVTVNTPGASTALYTTQTDITGLTLSGTNILKVTGTAGGGTGGTGDISAKLGTIAWYGAANN